MTTEVIPRSEAGSGLQACPECGRSFSHSQYLDHLFRSKDCMKRYWEEEEKTHVYRLRHHRGMKNIPK